MKARPNTALARLTPAQIRILEKIASGLDTPETARALGITQGTVSVQISSMSRRFGVIGRAALTHAGYCSRQLDPPKHTEFDGAFTETEKRMVRLVASGASHQKIADDIQISRATASERLRALRLRLGAFHDAHLVTLGWRYRLLDETQTVTPSDAFGAKGARL